uniref:Ricin B lectin domain-containing protein n=1 Tax=Glossina austeni TaxID=7395 RepID=A0A1A9VTS6_GLOAU
MRRAMAITNVRECAKRSHTRVVCSVIDVHLGASDDLRVGLDCNLIFKWEHLNPTERGTRQHSPTTTIRTSMLASGLFNMNKAYFTKLGKYDITTDVCVVAKAVEFHFVLGNVAVMYFADDILTHFWAVAAMYLRLIHFELSNRRWTCRKSVILQQCLYFYKKCDDLCLTFEQFARGSQVAMNFCNETENQHWKASEGKAVLYVTINGCLDSGDNQEHKAIIQH